MSGNTYHETKNATVVEMKSALVLNATFEPLSIVSVRRATCLVLSEKAELIENDGTEMRSERFTLASPLVVRLKYMVKVPYSRHTAMSRRAIMARDGHSCKYCGAPADSIDHVLPKSRGGMHVWENVAAACRTCNLRKRDRTPEEAGMPLVAKPYVPRESSWITLSVVTVPDQLKPYLALAS